jgi:hypothetical protein
MKTMAMQQRRVGQLTVKWDDQNSMGMFVTVHKKGLLVDQPVATFDDDAKTLEENITAAVAWAEENQDKAGASRFGLFG